MAQFQLELTERQREFLSNLLESRLGETRVEVHRTHTPAYRERVQDEEQLVRDLLKQLGSPAVRT